jgi:hypothetical protein
MVSVPSRYVEVKGSTGAVSSVELTVNEVTHANNYPCTDLIVVDNIVWSGSAETGYTTTGGVLRAWPSWSPEHDDLSVTRSRYDLPPSPTITQDR